MLEYCIASYCLGKSALLIIPVTLSEPRELMDTNMPSLVTLSTVPETVSPATMLSSCRRKRRLCLRSLLSVLVCSFISNTLDFTIVESVVRVKRL